MEANGIGEGYFGLSAFPPAHGPQQHDLEDGGRLKWQSLAPEEN